MISDLKKIIEIEGITREDGLAARKIALDNWIARHVTELMVENIIVKKHLNPSQQEYLKLHMSYQIAEKILEDHALVVTEGNKVKVKVLVLNKEFPKNKE